MEYKIIKSKAQDKARRSFNYQCRRASICRHDKFISSCNGCDDKSECEIQKMITKAKGTM